VNLNKVVISITPTTVPSPTSINSSPMPLNIFPTPSNMFFITPKSFLILGGLSGIL